MGMAIAFLQLAILLSAPAGKRPSARPASPGLGQRIAARASSFVGAESLELPHDDCSGFVELVYRREQVRLVGSSRELRQSAVRRNALRKGRARPGDLVFFRDTIPGKRGITHVGIVESVAKGGETTFVHRSRTGVRRSRLDLARRRTGRDARGLLHNDVLRGGPRPRLAGELFAGFAAAEQLARN